MGAELRLTELRPIWLRRNGASYTTTEEFAGCDGLRLLCPTCFLANKRSEFGVHNLLAWRTHVGIGDPSLGTGRWLFRGTGMGDLTLAPNTVRNESGCRCHFSIQEGRIVFHG